MGENEAYDQNVVKVYVQDLYVSLNVGGNVLNLKKVDSGVYGYENGRPFIRNVKMFNEFQRRWVLEKGVGAVNGRKWGRGINFFFRGNGSNRRMSL